MQTLVTVLERLFRQIAEDFECVLPDDEIGRYIAELSDLGLANLREACLCFTAERPERFPDVADFRKKIGELKLPRTSLSLGV